MKKSSETSVPIGELGRFVRRLRLRRKISLASAVKKSGLSIKRYEDIERGRADPTLTEIVNIGDAIEMAPSFILLNSVDVHALDPARKKRRRRKP